MLAMTSGRHAAKAVDHALSKGAARTAELRAYERVTRRRIAQYWEFIENFYQLPFTQVFFQPDNRLGIVCAINVVLAGCTELPLAAWWRLRLFFLLVRLNKWLPVVRRIRVS